MYSYVHTQYSQMLKIDALNRKSNAILIYFFGGQKNYSQIAQLSSYI